jgi:hypothetical protein
MNTIDIQLKALQEKLLDKYKKERSLLGLDMKTGEYSIMPDVLEAFRTSLETVQRETAEDICRMLDKIESQDENTSMDQWKQYKHMRNAIRDKYVPKEVSEHHE